MSKIKTFFRLLMKPRTMIQPITEKGYLDWLSDAAYVKLKYYGMTGKRLNLKTPKGFNEKIQYLKLYNHNPLYIQLADKYNVRKYVAERIGEEYLVKLYQKWDRTEDMDFSKLPDQFVLKCNHDSGSIRIIKNKSEASITELKEYYNQRFQRSAFLYGREWPYKSISPCVIAEEYLIDETGELRDYKFFCFNGSVKFFKVDFHRFQNHRANYYDINMNFLPIREMLVPNDPNTHIDFPNEIDNMMALACKLSQGMPFVRIDFYDVRGQIYFGEMTFYPGSGFDPFIPDEWEKKIGDMLILPDDIKICEDNT